MSNLKGNKKKNWQFSRELKIFLWCYCISRFFFLLTPGYTYDFYEYAVWGDTLLQGQNIYEYFAAIPQGILVLKYPPLFFVQCALILLIFGHFSWSIRLGFMCFEILTIIVLEKFSRKFSRGEISGLGNQAGTNFSLLYMYAFSPVTIFNFIVPQPWFLGAFYMMMGLMTFYLDKPRMVGLFMAIGFLTEYFPIFCLIPIIIFYISQKKWKNFFQMIIIFCLTGILCCLPFILLNPDLFLRGFLLQFSRIPQTASFWNLLNIFFKTTFSLFGIFEINFLGLTFLVFCAIFTCFTFYYMKKQKVISKSVVLWVSLIFFICLPLIFMSFDMRYFYWYFLIACLFYSRKISATTLNRMALSSSVFSIVYGLVFLIFWPNLIVVDQRILPSPEQVTSLLYFSLIFLGIILPFYLIYWYTLGEQLRKPFEIKQPNIHQVITISLGLFILEVSIALEFSLVNLILFTISFFVGFYLNLNGLRFLVKHTNRISGLL